MSMLIDYFLSAVIKKLLIHTVMMQQNGLIFRKLFLIQLDNGGTVIPLFNRHLRYH